MPTPVHNPALKAFGSAIGDTFLRALFIIAILSFGYWVPSSYLYEKYGIFSQFGPGPLADAAFSFAKVAAFAYGVFALWRLLRAPKPNNRAGADAG